MNQELVNELKKENLEVYAFGGYKGSGKNYVAEHIFLPMLSAKPTLVLNLADDLKVDVAQKMDIQSFSQTGIYPKEALSIHKVLHTKDDHVRSKLQYEGHEVRRGRYNDYNIDTFLNWMYIHASRGIRRFIITDIRYLNELEMIKELGGTSFLIYAPVRSGRTSNHPSETSMPDPHQFDHVIYNDESHDPVSCLRNLLMHTQLTSTCYPIADTTIFIDIDDTLCQCSVYYENFMYGVAQVIRKSPEFRRHKLEQVHQMVRDKIIDNMYEPFHLMKMLHQISQLAIKCSNYDHIMDVTIGLFRKHIINQNYEPIDEAVRAFHQLIKFCQDKQHNRDDPRTINTVLLTVGERPDQIRKLMHIGIDPTTLRIPVECHCVKDKTIFEMMKRKYKANHYVSIGDSFVRDVEPAVDAGIDEVFHIVPNPLQEKDKQTDIFHERYLELSQSPAYQHTRSFADFVSHYTRKLNETKRTRTNPKDNCKLRTK